MNGVVEERKEDGKKLQRDENLNGWRKRLANRLASLGLVIAVECATGFNTREILAAAL